MEKENYFSVWLVPDETDKKYLSLVVDDLSQKHNSPSFVPHLTLLGNTTVSFEELKSAVDNVFENQNTFEISSTGINHSELFFKTVFIEFDIDETLRKLFLSLSNETDSRSIDEFRPHISLMYKLMPEEEKIKVIQGLNLKTNYKVGAAYIVAPKVGDNDFNDVEGWRVLYQKELNH